MTPNRLCILINKPKARPFLIATWYRPPNSPVAKFNYLEKLLGTLDTENIEYYLLGNLNCDLSVTDLDHSSRVLMDIIGLYNLSQLINEPTRVTDFSSTLIDHIFTNTPDKVVCSGVSHISISDHSLIYAYRKLSVSLPSRGHSTIDYRKFKNFDSIKFHHDIRLQDWSHINYFNNPDDMWHAWKTTFNFIVEKHAPLCTKRVKAFKSPWITSHLKDEMHKRDIQKIKAVRLTILKIGFPSKKCVIQLIKRFFGRKKLILKILCTRIKVILKRLGRLLMSLHLKIGRLLR